MMFTHNGYIPISCFIIYATYELLFSAAHWYDAIKIAVFGSMSITKFLKHCFARR